MLSIVTSLLDKIPAAIRTIIVLVALEVMILLFPKTLAVLVLVATIIEVIREKNNTAAAVVAAPVAPVPPVVKS